MDLSQTIPFSIVDDDEVNISFQSGSSITANEAEATHDVVIVINVPGGGSLPEEVSVDVVDLLTGSAQASSVDYLFTTPTTVTFEANSNDGDTRTVGIQVQSDSLLEGDESINLELSTNDNVVLGQMSHSVTITDDEEATFAFTNDSSAVAEGDTGMVEIVLSISNNGTLAENISLSVDLEEAGTGSATRDDDFCCSYTESSNPDIPSWNNRRDYSNTRNPNS